MLKDSEHLALKVCLTAYMLASTRSQAHPLLHNVNVMTVVVTVVCRCARAILGCHGVHGSPGALQDTHPSPAACHMSTRQNTTALRTSGRGWWKAANRPGSSSLGPTDNSSLGLILGATICNTNQTQQAQQRQASEGPWFDTILSPSPRDKHGDACWHWS